MSRVELHPAYTYYALKQNALVAPLQKGEIVRSEPPKYDIIRGKHKVQDARTKWIRKRESKECLSYDTSFCLVLCLVEVPAEYWTYTLQVLKEPAKIIRQRSDTILIELLDSTSQLLTKVEVPPQYKTVELSFEENPAHYRVESNKEIEIAPATLRIKSDKNLTNVLFEWREVLCSDGDSWLTVQIIQKTLNKKGYKLKEDNIMGKATKKAIIDFQKKNGFPIGNLNIETLKALVLNDL